MSEFKKFIPLVLNPEELDMQTAERKAKVKNFMDITKDIESSDGKDFNHKVMNQGIHKGTRAMGSYGLMPNTIKEFAKRLKTPELQELGDMSPEEMYARMESDPQFESKVAEPIMESVLSKYGDQRLANYAYQHGHNLPAEKIKEKMQGSERDLKFMERYKPEEEKLAIEEAQKSIKQPKEDNYISKIKSFFTKN